MSDPLSQFMKSARYLPECMRDFHDQKDLFKTIHELVSPNEGVKDINWVQAHIYTVDCFLWFMARRGFTLQRSRRRLPFLDLQATLKAQNEKRDAASRAALQAAMNKDVTK